MFLWLVLLVVFVCVMSVVGVEDIDYDDVLSLCCSGVLLLL